MISNVVVMSAIIAVTRSASCSDNEIFSALRVSNILMNTELNDITYE